MKKSTVLYVEDDKEAREPTALLLEEFFDETLVGVDGEDGFEKFIENQKSIDVLITDINMPKLNGFELIKKIRKIDATLPILVLSAYNEPGFFMESIKLCVDGFIFKPIEMDQFLELIARVTQKRELLDESKRNLHFLKEYENAMNESCIVYRTDLEGIITYVNDNFCNISGYTQQELIGKNIHIVKHPNTPEEIFHDIWESIQDKQIWKGILRNISKDAKSYYVDTTIKPIVDLDGNIIEYIAIQHDITAIMDI